MKLKPHIFSALCLVAGTILSAISVSLFLLPNKIVSGGVSGIATVLYYTARIPAALSFIIINIVLLSLSIRPLGKSFILKTLAGSVLFSLFIELFSLMPPLTNHIVLASLFGGILHGCGVGLVLVSGASTGGTDIIGRILQRKFQFMPISKLLLIADGVVIAISFAVFRQSSLALFGMLTLFMGVSAIDWLLRRLNNSQLAFVVSECREKITTHLKDNFRRGITLVDAKGGYTGHHKLLLLCALKSHEAPAFEQMILSIDPNAFVIFTQSQFILGNGFLFYR